MGVVAFHRLLAATAAALLAVLSVQPALRPPINLPNRRRRAAKARHSDRISHR